MNCVYSNHQYEEITGICLKGCDQRPWICMRCIIEKHKNHQDKCKTFSQIISLIDDVCHNEVKRQQNELKIIEELIGKSKLIVQEVENNLNKYHYWIKLIIDQSFKTLDIRSLIDTLNKTQSQDVVIGISLQELENQAKEMVKLGQRLQTQNQYFEALDQYEKSLEVDFKSIDALMGKGECLLILTRYEDAEKCFDYVLKTDPNNIQALFGKGNFHYILGECLRMIDKDKEAINYYNKILQQDPNHAPSLVSKGSCLRYLNHPDEAIKCLDQNTWQAWFEKGHCLKQKKKFKEAQLCFEKSLSLNPQDDEIIYEKCKTHNILAYCQNPHSFQ